MIALEAFADGRCVPAQPSKPPLPALGLQACVQLFPTRYAWNRNHEVPPGIAHQALDLTLIAALGRPSKRAVLVFRGSLDLVNDEKINGPLGFY
jgi:hypothetical protein